MAQVLMDQVVDTDHRQLDLVWGEDGQLGGDDDRSFEGQLDGWVGAASPAGKDVVLGRRPVAPHVRVVLHDTEPPDGEDTWEDLVQVSVTIPSSAEVGWATWAGEGGGDLAVPHGSYRVRASARGRGAGAADDLADGVVDHHLLEPHVP